MEKGVSMDRSLGFIGGGRITRIFLTALRARGTDLSTVMVSEPDAAAAKSLAASFPDLALTTDNKKAAACDVVFLALHPPVMKDAVNGIAGALLKDAVVVSLAPKHSISALSGMLGGFTRIARMIPNAPSIIGKGFNPVCFSPSLTAEDVSALDPLFSAFGTCPRVKEGDCEAYAVLTAMGPTYFLFQIKTIMDLACGFGLAAADVKRGMQAMLEGMVSTVFASGLSMDQVIDLIPGKPMAPHEETIRKMYESSLNGIYAKLKS
jgi:pyrroline-5-carboxylate reductase